MRKKTDFLFWSVPSTNMEGLLFGFTIGELSCHPHLYSQCFASVNLTLLKFKWSTDLKSAVMPNWLLFWRANSSRFIPSFCFESERLLLPVWASLQHLYGARVPVTRSPAARRETLILGRAHHPEPGKKELASPAVYNSANNQTSFRWTRVLNWSGCCCSFSPAVCSLRVKSLSPGFSTNFGNVNLSLILLKRSDHLCNMKK